MLMTILVLGAGLAIRRFPNEFPVFVGLYVGDALWAMAVYAGLCTIFAKSMAPHLVFAAATFSFLIEFSQMYNGPWIQDLRAHWLGGLILGHGFLFTDLLAYLVGIGCGILFDVGMLRPEPEEEPPPPLWL